MRRRVEALRRSRSRLSPQRFTLAHSQRGWTGARTPSAIKRVRQTERRRLINQPRRTAAKTLVSKAMVAANDVAHNGGSPDEVRAAVERAVSALDRAAKIGAIHRNSADRRKSRLMLKVNAALGGETVTTAAKSARQIGKAAATKEAKARIAAGRAVKAKGAQTAAGKARAALAKTSRAEASATTATADTDSEPKATTKPAAKASSKTASKASGSKSTTSKAAPKATATKAAKKS
jgi:small subunit ribosomal protein S20